MQPAGIDFQQDFFHLFNLSVHYRLDSALLDQRFHALQMQVHPDKFSHLPEAERRVSMQWATRVNEAYQTLADPIRRARYLLSLQGVSTEEEANTAMPGAFLIEQMEWREAIQEARDARDMAVLEELESRLQHETHALQQQLAVKIDTEHDYAAAAAVVRKLKFLEKLGQDIDSTYDQLDH